MKKRKGQWLLITALLFSIAISSVMLMKSQTRQFTDIGYSTKNTFNNMKTESVSAINIILSENYTHEHLESDLKIYNEFLKYYSSDHNADISGYHIIGIPKGSSLNVTVANFLGTSMKDLNITVGGISIQNQEIADGNFTTYSFTSVPSSFNFSYSFTHTEEGTETLENDTFTTQKKVFDITYLKMETDNDIWTNYGIN